MEVKRELNAAIRDIPMPLRLRRRPINENGFPVPWFVAEIDGKWDFRAIAPSKIVQAYRKRVCWLCGDQLGRHLAFVIGPMCSINRITSEPPSHLECAQYAVKACPFLANPRMRRNEVDLPEGTVSGVHLDHNPTAAAIWITRHYHPFNVKGGGSLFKLGDPSNVLWYHRGRPASRDEVMAAINKGLPILQKITESDGPKAKQELDACVARAMLWLPKQEDDNARPVRLCEPSGEGVRNIGEGSGKGGTTDPG